jgi:hypothetical protein
MDDFAAEAQRVISELRDQVRSGERHWFLALMQAIRDWPLPVEECDERLYRYVVGGEAFDWLLLAERLCGEVEGLIPEEEVDALLFGEVLPRETTEDEFRELMGAKYKLHLNHVYGVRVEAALLLAVAAEVRKEQSAGRIWERNGAAEDEAHRRIYGRAREEMLEDFRKEAATGDSEWLSLADFAEWRYWLFKYRVRNSDPARVASDTRKGLAQIQRMQRARRPAEAAVMEPAVVTVEGGL